MVSSLLEREKKEFQGSERLRIGVGELCKCEWQVQNVVK